MEGEDVGWDGSGFLMLQHWAKDQDQYPVCLCIRYGSSQGPVVKRICTGPGADSEGEVQPSAHQTWAHGVFWMLQPVKSGIGFAWK